MAQSLATRTAGNDADNTAPRDLPGGMLDLGLIQGQTLRWLLCFCEDPTTITMLDGDNETITLAQDCGIAANDCIYVYGHIANCRNENMNGSHTITAATNNVLTIADVPVNGTVDFSPPVMVVGCDEQDTTPPTACKINSAAAYTLCGQIMNRVPTEDTRLALVARSTEGSPYIRLEEDGEVFAGDTFTFQAAGISNARVKRVYPEQGRTFLELDTTASTAACGAASTEVGVLAEFKFRVDDCGCIIAYIDQADINCLPLLGDRISGNRRGMGRGRQGMPCADVYQIGHYAITAKYIDTNLEIESHLIAYGCVELTATVKKVLD